MNADLDGRGTTPQFRSILQLDCGRELLIAIEEIHSLHHFASLDLAQFQRQSTDLIMPGQFDHLCGCGGTRV
jgi:hypothetical protein